MGRVIQAEFTKRYAAGRPSRSGKGWIGLDRDINSLITQASPHVRARIRQLVRDFPYFKRAKQIMMDFSVGTGIELQARPLDRNNTYAPGLAREIEYGYKRFMDEVDIAGRLHGKEMERLAKGQDIECGEFFLLKARDNDPKRYVPFCLQMYDAAWLNGGIAGKVHKDHRLINSVEVHAKSGKIMAYHFQDPDGFTAQRIEAQHVIHGFETTRAGQVRGISDFTSGVDVTTDLAEALDGEVSGFKYAAKWLAFVVANDPMGRQMGNGVTSDQIEELENGIIEYLNPGESVQLATNPRPSAGITPFVRIVLLMISAATGVPYELLAMDYQGLNWAVIKVIRADFKQTLRPISARHARQCCDPIYREFLTSAVLNGRINIPDYFTDPWRYQNAIWQPPISDAVDKLRDSKSDISEMEAGTKSGIEIIAARGRQAEDVLDEAAEFKKMMAARGLDMGDVSTALANNPAALEN